VRKLQNLPITFTQRDYRETPDDVLVYADPPYILTKSYSKRTFDFLAFRQWVLARKGPTFVSELTMPATLQVVWEQSYKSQMTPCGETVLQTAVALTIARYGSHGQSRPQSAWLVVGHSQCARIRCRFTSHS